MGLTYKFRTYKYYTFTAGGANCEPLRSEYADSPHLPSAPQFFQLDAGRQSILSGTRSTATVRPDANVRVPLFSLSSPGVPPMNRAMKHPCRVLTTLTALLGLVGCELASQGLNVDGVRMYEQGNYQGAAQRFNRAIANDPVSAEGYYNLAATLHRTGTMYNQPQDLKQAENLYNQCLERDPNHVECYRGLAVLLTETERTDAAFRLLEGWHRLSPQSAEPKIELARLLEETGSHEASKAQLVEALALDPHNSRGLTAMARLRDRDGDHAQALADYQRSLEINAMQPEVRTRVATLQAALGGPVVSSVAPMTDTRFVRQPSATARY